ncbi:MAG: tyrosine-type recombinase/integrase [Chloroflexi bacterium]|nr:tyrosine-type recombinase/integrase [Chloroflexota bacterium]
MDLAQARQDFLDTLAEKNKAFLTTTTYAYSLDRFLAYVAEHHRLELDAPVTAVTLEQVRQFGLWLYHQRLAATTRVKHLVVLRNWFKYLAGRGLASLNPALIELPRVRRSPPNLDERLPIMLSLEAPAPDAWRELIRLRDRAILETLFSTQLRVSELVALDRTSLDWQQGTAVITGKGGKTRTVFFSERALEALNAYLDARPDQFLPLFIHHDRAHRPTPKDRDGTAMRLTRQGVEAVVRRYARMAGVDATPHDFRHYGATELLRNGADIRTVQELLGHASVATTQIYTHVNPQRLHREWRRFHPAAERDREEPDGGSEGS